MISLSMYIMEIKIDLSTDPKQFANIYLNRIHKNMLIKILYFLSLKFIQINYELT
jgi:hypothetical protein